MSVEILGMDKVINRLAVMEKALEPESEKQMKTVGKLMKEYSKSIAAVDTGSMRTSIRMQVFAKIAGKILRVGVSAGGYIVNPKTGKLVNYAKFIEWGTSKMLAQPFMRPAMEKYKHLIPKKIRDGLHR